MYDSHSMHLHKSMEQIGKCVRTLTVVVVKSILQINFETSVFTVFVCEFFL